MIYTSEEKRELDSILSAFDTYIKGQSYFDVLYSDRIGYVSLTLRNPGENTVVFRSARQLLCCLFSEVTYNAVFASADFDSEDTFRPLTVPEQANIRRILAERLGPLEKGGAYLSLLDEWLRAYPESERAAWRSEA